MLMKVLGLWNMYKGWLLRTETFSIILGQIQLKMHHFNPRIKDYMISVIMNPDAINLRNSFNKVFCLNSYVNLVNTCNQEHSMWLSNELPMFHLFLLRVTVLTQGFLDLCGVISLCMGNLCWGKSHFCKTEGSHTPSQVKPTNSKWTHAQFPKVMYCVRGHEVMSLKEFWP